jgi:hypothetical protein
MMPNSFDDPQLVRAEIAAVAARLIAEDGADYGSAKRKAARQVLGEQQASSKQGSNFLPDNALIENEVRLYNALFLADSQPARLLQLRTRALQVMDALQQFRPFLTGAVLNGTAGPHDDIHLQLFTDSAKDVEIFLLNKNVQIDISETAHFKGPRYDAVETVSFLWHGEGVHAALYQPDDLRGALKARPDGKPVRADSGAVRALLTEPATDTATSTSKDRPVT